MSYGTCQSCDQFGWLDTLPGIDGKPVRVCESKECRIFCACGEQLVTEQGEMCEWCRENTKEAA
jgi:hypothetical protein